ncbi:hypothetical protein [Sphingopyxis sp. KK2]|uniref:hypothetical protein n=1 Tax=Sphingopyxis sp. KK2 TaxID=1855727 RepID=UPI0011819078|nr:hypothetical protein [Sphingopyxis sp. KK2]
MKASSRYIVLFTALGIAFFTVAITSTGTAYDDEACHVALQILQEKKRGIVGPVAVSIPSAATPTTRTAAEEIVRDIRRDGPVDPAEEFMLELIVKSADVDELRPVEECENVQQWMKSSHIIHDQMQIEKAEPVNGRYPFAIVRLSMPAVSNDGNHALMYISTTYGPLAGGGYMAWIKRQEDDRWAIDEEMQMWVS